MKRMKSAAVLGTVLLVGAGVFALPIDNRVKCDGTPVLIPAVRKYEPRSMPATCRGGATATGITWSRR